MFDRVVCFTACALAVSFAPIGCSRFDGVDSTAATGDAGSVENPEGDGGVNRVSPRPGADAPVDGIVRGTDDEAGQPGRAITLVDARGQKFTTTTAADGTFHFTAVAVPYDVRVHNVRVDGKEGPGIPDPMAPNRGWKIHE